MRVTQEIRIDSGLFLKSTAAHRLNGQKIMKWSQLKAAVNELMSSKDCISDSAMFDSALECLQLVNSRNAFPEKAEAFAIIQDLLNGLTCLHPTRRRYSLASKMFFLFVKNISTAAYEYLSSMFSLPHERKLRELTSANNR